MNFDQTKFANEHAARANDLKSQMPSGHLAKLGLWLYSYGFVSAAASVGYVHDKKSPRLTDIDAANFATEHARFVKKTMKVDVENFGRLLSSIGLSLIAFKELGYRAPSISEKITTIDSARTTSGTTAVASESGCLAPTRERQVAGARR